MSSKVNVSCGVSFPSPALRREGYPPIPTRLQQKKVRQVGQHSVSFVTLRAGKRPPGLAHDHQALVRSAAVRESGQIEGPGARQRTVRRVEAWAGHTRAEQ